MAAIARDGSWLSIHSSPLHGPGPDALVLVIRSARPGDASAALVSASHLTPRESDVAAEAVRGLSDRAIARSLGLIEYTVQDHLEHVYAKTGARGRAEFLAHLLSG